VGELLAALPEGLRARVDRAREIDRRRRETTAHGEPLPTAVSALDLLLDGGLPRGHLVELIGARSSGRFSALLAALAGATTAGEAAVLIDLGDGLDPAAALAAGVELERLLWVRPTDFKAALAAAETAIGGGFPLVVLDLGSPPLRARAREEGVWLRLARAARAQGTALLLGAPYRVSGPAAVAVLRAARGRVDWREAEAVGAPPILAGLGGRLILEKQRGGDAAGRAEELRLAVADLPTPPATRGTIAGTLLRRAVDPIAAVGPIAAVEPVDPSLLGNQLRAVSA
jgi:hypothetical protein